MNTRLARLRALWRESSVGVRVSLGALLDGYLGFPRRLIVSLTVFLAVVPVALVPVTLTETASVPFFASNFMAAPVSFSLMGRCSPLLRLSFPDPTLTGFLPVAASFAGADPIVVAVAWKTHGPVSQRARNFVIVT